MKLVVDEDFPRAREPAGFHATFFEPQRALFQAMLDLEASAGVVPAELPMVRECDALHRDGPPYGGRSAILHAPLSSGKTFLGAALALAPPPAGGPLHYGNNTDNCITEMYTITYTRRIPATIVFANSAIINEWAANVERHTDVGYIVLDNVHALRAYEEALETGEARRLRVVLVRNGRVTATYKTRSGRGSFDDFFNAVVAATAGYCWDRVIIDDGDMTTRTTALMPGARYVWFFSTTMRLRRIQEKHLSYTALLQLHNYRATHMLTANTDYVHAHMTTTQVAGTMHVTREQAAVRRLLAAGLPPEIAEMINAEAFHDAAAALGVTADTPGELFAALIRKDQARVISAMRITARLDALQIIQPYGMVQEGFAAAVRELDDAAWAEYVATEHINKASVEQARHTAHEHIEKHGRRLERLRENMAEGACQVCALPRDEIKGLYTLNCCQVLVCDECVWYQGKFLSKCPNCAQQMGARDAVRLGDKIAAGDLTNAALLTTIAMPEPEPAPALPLAPAPAELDDDAFQGLITGFSPKLQKLAYLITGREGGGELRCAPFGLYQDAFLRSERDNPLPAGEPRRFLVFGLLPQTVRGIMRLCATLGLVAIRLAGTMRKKREILREFRSGGASVLVLTAVADCAGINLPEITHLAIMQRLQNRDMFYQAVGRALRVNRVYNLSVHEIVGEKEAEGVHLEPPGGNIAARRAAQTRRDEEDWRAREERPPTAAARRRMEREQRRARRRLRLAVLEAVPMVPVVPVPDEDYEDYEGGDGDGGGARAGPAEPDED